MSKLIFVLSIALALLPAASLAQSGSDPLHWTDTIRVKSDNIFLLWSQLSNDSVRCYQQVYRYALGPNSSQLSLGARVLPANPPSDQTVAYGNGQMDVAAGYFGRSVFESVVTAWESYDQKIHVMIPRFDSTDHLWSTSSVMTVPGTAASYYTLTSSSTSGRGRIYVRTGDFLGNGLDQFVLAYEGADSLVHMQVYGVDDNLVPHLLASVQADTFDVNPPWAKFSIATGDLNGDGKDEIILNNLKMTNGGGRANLYAKVYELNGSSLVSEGDTLVSSWNTGAANVSGVNFGACIGNFNGGSGNEIGLTVATYYAGATENFNTYFLTASQDLKNLSHSTGNPIKTSLSSSRNGAFAISSGDLNGDGRDELVFADLGQIYVCGIDSSGSGFVNHLAAHFSSEEYDDIVTYDYLGVGDLDQDGSADVVVSKGIWSAGKEGFELFGLGIKPDLLHYSTLFDTTYARTVPENNINSLFHYALVLGAFDGNSFRIGPPIPFEVDSVRTPMVILNTPPVHFDILNGKRYDLSNSFSGSAGSFYSTYVQQSSSSVNIETKIHNAVSNSAGVDLSGSTGITFGEGVQASISANFEFKVEGTWGHSYATDTSKTQTVSFNFSEQAMGDDEILASTSSYHVTAYPVYEGKDSTPVSYLNFASPIANKSSCTWFPSKSFAIGNYAPNHEVGNVLSYLPPDSASSNPNIDSSIVPTSQKYEFTISPQAATPGWDLDYSQYQTSKLGKSWNTGWDSEISSVLESSSTGDHVHMTTNTTTIMSGFDLHATLGSLVDSLGNAADYTIYPYAYRSRQGAVVLDYAVQPDEASPGQPETWWQQEYSKPDPTFVLPWFYSVQEGEKGDSAKKYETSDVMFSNNAPKPGDVITITARVRNFSLVTTTIPVTVEFFVGSPDSGGTLITGTNGVDSVTTAKPIPSRYWEDAAMKWKVPSGLPQYPRIYAVIDPSNLVKEVHESNNMGFAVLGEQPSTSTTGIVQGEAPNVPKSPVLYQSFPNPFNPTAQIEYAVPARSLVVLTVYDVLGQKVETLVSGVESAGIHKVTFNGSRYASGVYFYRITVRSLMGNHFAYSKTMKMLELK